MKKKKGILFIGMFFIASLVLNMFIPPIVRSAEEDTYLIATDATFAPFEFQNQEGEYVGIDIDLLAAIAED